MKYTGRIFSTLNINNGVINWYFKTREGNQGPYPSKSQAELSLKRFIEASGHQEELVKHGLRRPVLAADQDGTLLELRSK